MSNIYLDSTPPPSGPSAKEIVPAQREVPTREEVNRFLANLEDRDYRVTFKNGCSTECGGMALKHNFCYDPEQIESIVPVVPGFAGSVPEPEEKPEG